MLIAIKDNKVRGDWWVEGASELVKSSESTFNDENFKILVLKGILQATEDRLEKLIFLEAQLKVQLNN